jgi:hypothetical protein
VRPRRLGGASGRPLNFTVRRRRSFAMATHRRYTAFLAPPVVMAVLLAFPLPDFIRDLRGPLLAAAIAYAIAACLILFWGCFWVATVIGRFLGATSAVALLIIGASVQLSLTAVGSVATWYVSHLLTVQRVLVDCLEQTAAYIVSYLVYRALKPQGGATLAAPTPNNRWRGP